MSFFHEKENVVSGHWPLPRYSSLLPALSSIKTTDLFQRHASTKKKSVSKESRQQPSDVAYARSTVPPWNKQCLSVVELYQAPRQGRTLDKLVGIGVAMAQLSKGRDWRFHTSCRPQVVFDLHKISR